MVSGTSLEAAPDPVASRASDDQIRRHQGEVRDAGELLAWALAEGRPVPDETVQRINEAEAVLAPSAPFPKPSERARFEQAYRDLAQLVAPVTVRTLRATSDEHGYSTVWGPMA